jgi:hypothetical protein
MTNNSILKLSGAFHCVKTSRIRFWAFSYSIGDPCGRSDQLSMYFIGILRGAAMARFISVAWLHCSRLLLLHQTALTAKRAKAARAVTPILALNGGRRFFAMQSDAIGPFRHSPRRTILVVIGG